MENRPSRRHPRAPVVLLAMIVAVTPTLSSAPAEHRNAPDGRNHRNEALPDAASWRRAALFFPAQTSDSAEVAAMVERFHAALTAGDSTTVADLLAAEAVILESGGVETREQYLGGHLRGDIAFAQAVPRRPGPVQVRVAGDVAWATSTSVAQGDYRGREINSVSAELMVLVRDGGRWRIAAVHWSSRARRPTGPS